MPDAIGTAEWHARQASDLAIQADNYKRPAGASDVIAANERGRLRAHSALHAEVAQALALTRIAYCLYDGVITVRRNEE